MGLWRKLFGSKKWEKAPKRHETNQEYADRMNREFQDRIAKEEREAERGKLE